MNNNFKDFDNSDFTTGGRSNSLIRNSLSPNLNSLNNNNSNMISNSPSSIGVNSINNINNANINNSLHNSGSNISNNNNNNNIHSNSPNNVRININNISSSPININKNSDNNNSSNNNNNGSLNNNNNNNNSNNNKGGGGDSTLNRSSTSEDLTSSLSDLPPLSDNYGQSTSHFESNFDNYLVKDRQCSSYADRVLFSNKYYYSYVLMIIVNLILIIWLITNLIKKNTSVPSHWLFIVLDILVNVTLSIEIALQLISQKKKYFQTWSNIFDLFVLIISVGGLFLYFHSTTDGNNYDYEGALIILLTGIRYFFQFLRLLALINRQKLKKSTFNSRIDFTELRENDIDFDIDSQDDF